MTHCHPINWSSGTHNLYDISKKNLRRPTNFRFPTVSNRAATRLVFYWNASIVADSENSFGAKPLHMLALEIKHHDMFPHCFDIYANCYKQQRCVKPLLTKMVCPCFLICWENTDHFLEISELQPCQYHTMMPHHPRWWAASKSEVKDICSSLPALVSVEVHSLNAEP